MRILMLTVLTTGLLGFAAEAPLQSSMDNILARDSRNAGIRVAVNRKADSLTYDLRAINAQNSMTDAFRVLLQFAQAEKSVTFTSVTLMFQGKPKFILPGSYFNKLGNEFSWQNPVYTMRTFPPNVLNLDGSSAFPEWTGRLGVAAKQMEQFTSFSRRWYLNDVLAQLASALEQPRPAANRPSPKASLDSTGSGVGVRGAARFVLTANESVESIRIPDWLPSYSQAREVTTPTERVPFSTYRAEVPAETVVNHYEYHLRTHGIDFRRTYNGIGTTIQAASEVQACVIRVGEVDNGTKVEVRCAAKTEPKPIVRPEPELLPPGAHRVEYRIGGSAGRASLTYRNASGGSEQNVVSPPTSLSFIAREGAFLYMSAQNESERGTVRVTILVDGRVLQEAVSSTRFGIASASGSVQR